MRTLAAALVAVTLVGALALGAAPAASAPAGDSTTTAPVPDPPLPAPDIIPEPDSGAAPTDAGDRGGVLQATVLAGIVAGVALIGALVVRESRRSRRTRGF